ncbi:MAG: protein kinase [Archangium sp.]|nr:protein kinase [Archangium sp.]
MTDGKRLGRYELLEQLGEGGMGTVWLARLTGAAGFEKLCIVKTVLPSIAKDADFVSRFLHEGRVLTQLSHGNIAQVLDMNEADGQLFLALEYVAGVDLWRLHEQVRAAKELMPLPLVVALITQAADGLGAAHRKAALDGSALNIVHRDVSPHNIMVSYEGEVKVIDFGIAKSEARSRHTAQASVMGKLGYMAPEQARGEAVDHRADQYALAIVAWELMSNQSWVKRGTLTEMVVAMAHPTLRPIVPLRAEVPPSLEAVVLKALSPLPEGRYASTDEFAQALMGELLKLGPPPNKPQLGQYVRSRCATDFATQRQLLTRVSTQRSPPPDAERPKIDMFAETAVRAGPPVPAGPHAETGVATAPSRPGGARPELTVAGGPVDLQTPGELTTAGPGVEALTQAPGHPERSRGATPGELTTAGPGVEALTQAPGHPERSRGATPGELTTAGPGVEALTLAARPSSAVAQADGAGSRPASAGPESTSPAPPAVVTARAEGSPLETSPARPGLVSGKEGAAAALPAIETSAAPSEESAAQPDGPALTSSARPSVLSARAEASPGETSPARPAVLRPSAGEESAPPERPSVQVNVAAVAPRAQLPLSTGEIELIKPKRNPALLVVGLVAVIAVVAIVVALLPARGTDAVVDAGPLDSARGERDAGMAVVVAPVDSARDERDAGPPATDVPPLPPIEPPTLQVDGRLVGKTWFVTNHGTRNWVRCRMTLPGQLVVDIGTMAKGRKLDLPLRRFVFDKKAAQLTQEARIDCTQGFGIIFLPPAPPP